MPTDKVIEFVRGFTEGHRFKGAHSRPLAIDNIRDGLSEMGYNAESSQGFGCKMASDRRKHLVTACPVRKQGGRVSYHFVEDYDPFQKRSSGNIGD